MLAQRLSMGLIGVLLGLSGAVEALELSPAEAAGKRLYREGLSLNGAQVSARIGAADMVVPAATVPCASCHGADGRGRPEGGVRPPDITWRRLSTAYGQPRSAGRNHPPYTDASVARAIGDGLDPAGNRLEPTMPRFVMSSADQLSLLAYLKRIEEDADPGVDSDTLRLGTLLPSQGPLAGLAATVAAVLRGTLDSINDGGGIHGRRLALQIVDPGPDAASAQAALQRLLDSGAVFALVAPLAPALEQGITATLEQAGLPWVGSMSLMGGRQSSRLIFEPLPGLVEQLRALSRYADQQLALAGRKASILYPLDPLHTEQAQALARELSAQGWTQLSLQSYRRDRLPVVGSLRSEAQSVFYLGLAEDFRTLVGGLEQGGQTPYLFATSGQVPADILQLPRAFSQRVFLAYPFLPRDWTVAGKAALAKVRERSGLNGQNPVLQVDAYCSMLLIGEALRQIGRNPSREQLVSALEGLHDVQTGLTPPLSFGPGRRLGLQGAPIVTLDLLRRRFELAPNAVSRSEPITQRSLQNTQAGVGLTRENPD